MSVNDEKYQTVCHLVFVDPKYKGDSQYGHVQAEFVKRFEDGKIRNFYGGNGYGGEDLGGLVVTCQYDSTDPDKLYGERIGFEHYSEVTLDLAERYVKVLRKIEKGLKRLEDDLGHPDTFAAYVIRVCHALGVKVVITSKDTPSWDDANVTTWKVGEITFVVSDHIWQVKQRLNGNKD